MKNTTIILAIAASLGFASVGSAKEAQKKQNFFEKHRKELIIGGSIAVLTGVGIYYFTKSSDTAKAVDAKVNKEDLEVIALEPSELEKIVVKYSNAIEKADSSLDAKGNKKQTRQTKIVTFRKKGEKVEVVKHQGRHKRIKQQHKTSNPKKKAKAEAKAKLVAKAKARKQMRENTEYRHRLQHAGRIDNTSKGEKRSAPAKKGYRSDKKKGKTVNQKEDQLYKAMFSRSKPAFW